MISIKPDEPEKLIPTADDPWLDELSAIDPPVSPGDPMKEPEVQFTKAPSEQREDIPDDPRPTSVEPIEPATPPTIPLEDHYPIIDPAATAVPPPVHSVFETEEPLWPNEQPIFDNAPPPLAFEPEPQYETVRRSGLAWSAGIVFFATVAFTLLLGWIADLIIGSAPWGLVGGIVFGSILAFIQFFRISARIFPSRDKGPAVNPLMSQDKDEDDLL